MNEINFSTTKYYELATSTCNQQGQIATCTYEYRTKTSTTTSTSTQTLATTTVNMEVVTTVSMVLIVGMLFAVVTALVVKKLT